MEVFSSSGLSCPEGIIRPPCSGGSLKAFPLIFPKGSILSGTILSGTGLAETVLSETGLTETRLTLADLTGSAFTESDFTEKAEKLLGCKLSQDFFIATMVSSIQGGPEAIVMGADDDAKQDIFDINKAPLDAFYLIGHEFIIFLLMQELKEVCDFDGLNDWKRFESLAEYYLIQILGNSRGFFDFVKDYIEFYENCNKEI